MQRRTERERLLAAVDDGPLDAHAATLRSVLDCDAALVTVLDEEDQRFLGMHGMRGRPRSRRGTPLDRSLCRDVATEDDTLWLDDLTSDPHYRQHGALTHLGVEAYLGVPLRTPSGQVVGAVCGLHNTPRAWSGEDLTHLERVRDLVQEELRRLLDASGIRAANTELGLVLSTLRHELGGQLAIVLGGVETAMLPGIDDDLRRRVLTNARRDCRQAIATLDALLRADSRSPDKLQQVDVAELVAEVAQDAAAVHATKRVRVAAQPTSLVTEPTLVRHVVRNLVDNACKYSDGSVLVTAAPAGRGAEIVVVDHGPGIPAEVIDQLYEPFSRTREDGGASGFGLGLYIIRTLCRRLGAGIAVDTRADGTAITITVPHRGQSPKPSNAASSSDGA